tara:strand:+ start:9474 stop:11024 length:1551 start_codon:yes stop_codon:yes gene_type:complete
MKNVVICGCVKNCEKYIEGVFKNIKIISAYCNLIKIVISFDMSDDKTLFKLCEYKKKFNMDIIINKNPLHGNRVVNITNARNKYMEHLKGIKENIDKFIVMDFDDVCSTKVNELTISKVFNDIDKGNYEKCCITFNNERYYDYWALSLEEYIYSVWHTNNPQKMMYEMKEILYEKMSKCEDYIVVDSAFNGFGIYDYDTFKDIMYDYNINLGIFDKKKLGCLQRRGYLIQTRGIDCEHRLFHLKARQNNGKIIIIKDCLFKPYYGEHAAFLYKNEAKKKIYVCHYTPLKERKESFIRQSEKINIEEMVIFLEKNDRERIDRNNLNIFDTNKLKMSEISLFLKHLDGMKMILSDDNNNYGILMEDDCIFKENFLHYLIEYMKSLPKEFDIIYPGYFPFSDYYKQCTGNINPISDEMIGVNRYFYNMTNKMVFPWTGNNKGTDFFIISKKCCKLILDDIEKKRRLNEKMSKPIDHYLGTFLFNNKANVYWTNDNIVEHGSLTIFKNSMEGRPNCLKGV